MPNNTTFGLGHFVVNHGNLKIVHDPDGVDSDLAIVKAFIHALQRGPSKIPIRILERDSMARKVTSVLPWVPNVVHRVRVTFMYLREG
jgi:hypothetical protein